MQDKENKRKRYIRGIVGGIVVFLGLIALGVLPLLFNDSGNGGPRISTPGSVIPSPSAGVRTPELLPGTPTPSFDLPTSPSDESTQPPLPIDANAIVTKECKHYGLGDYGDGFTYEEVSDFAKDGWRLPSKQEFEAIEMITKSCPNIRDEILPGEPYWTSETTSLGKAYTYCFFEIQGNCQAKYEYYDPTEAFAILLIREGAL